MNREHQKPADEGGNLYRFPFSNGRPRLVRAQVDHIGRGQVLQGPWPKRSASQLPAVEGSTQPLVREGPKGIESALVHFPRFVDRILMAPLSRDAQYGECVAQIIQRMLFDPVMLDIDNEVSPHGAVGDVFEAPYLKLLRECDEAGQLRRAVIVEWLEDWDKEDQARSAVTDGFTVDRYQFVVDMNALLREHARCALVPVTSDAYRAISSIVPLFFILCVTPNCPSGMDAHWFTLVTRYTDRFPQHTWGRSTRV